MYTHLLQTASLGNSNYSTEIILIWLGILTIGVALAIWRRSRQHPLPPSTNPSLASRHSEELALRNRITSESLQQSKAALFLMINAMKEIAEKDIASQELQRKLNTTHKHAMELQRSFALLSEATNDNNYSNELSVREYNIFDVSDYILNSFAGEMERNRIVLNKSQSSQKEINAWIDNKKIEFVLHNLFREVIRNIDYNKTISIEIKQQNNNCMMLIDFHSTLVFSDSMFNLARKIILLHHGELSVTQDDEGKHTIVFTLQLGKDHFKNDKNVRFALCSPPSSPPTSTPVVAQEIKSENRNSITVDSPPKRNRLLIVEDNKDVRAYIKAILSSSYDIIMAENGQEGIDTAKRECPDLVLCDIMMPIKDGFECCREIKEDVNTCHIPVIMLTAREEDEAIIKSTLMGADDYLIKPFNTEVLRAKISNLIRTRQALKHNYMKLLNIVDDQPNTEEETRPSEEEETTNEDQKFINHILDTIEKNIQEPDFSAKKLAEIVGMSQSTLYRRIKQYSDFTIIELIRGVRLKRAATLLKEQHYSVQEVVEIVGYNDIPTFRKHFVDLFGMLPSAYASMNTPK